MKGLQQVYNRLFIDRLLGGNCVLCGVPAPAGLCPGCRSDLRPLGPACQRCAAPLTVDGICGECLQHPPPQDAALAAFRYEPPLSNLLVAFKFHGRLAAARPLGGLLAQQLAPRIVTLPDVILPVPLHSTRLRERGYNQALELARPLARRLGILLAPEMATRLRATANQTNLDHIQRRRNMRGAFGVIREVPRSVAIVDDVITTGSTVGELANVLREAGAAHIQVWALARA